MTWTRDEVLKMSGGYQEACVLMAAAELDVFTALKPGPATATALAGQLRTHPRATAVLLDALAALELLSKQGETYSVPAGLGEVLTEAGRQSVLAMVRHRANCLRRWDQLARVVQTGQPARREPSVRGEAGDQQSFIGAMNDISGPNADRLVAEIAPESFNHLLDVGGASGTWTIAFLRAAPEATATIFDLPEVIPMARERIAEAGMSERVQFAPGDFDVDPLPGGADLVWLSAIAHQNSREQNRGLFAKIHGALDPGGVLLLRDVVLDGTRLNPPAGALFAINMLVATTGGGCYTFNEYREDLATARFVDITLVREDTWMDAIIRAVKA